jgi:hypothetical protein
VAAKKKPVKKDDRGKIVKYEETKGAVALGDLCIAVSW